MADYRVTGWRFTHDEGEGSVAFLVGTPVAEIQADIDRSIRSGEVVLTDSDGVVFARSRQGVWTSGGERR